MLLISRSIPLVYSHQCNEKAEVQLNKYPTEHLHLCVPILVEKSLNASNVIIHSIRIYPKRPRTIAIHSLRPSAVFSPSWCLTKQKHGQEGGFLSFPLPELRGCELRGVIQNTAMGCPSHHIPAFAACIKHKHKLCVNIYTK